MSVQTYAVSTLKPFRPLNIMILSHPNTELLEFSGMSSLYQQRIRLLARD